MQRVFVAIVMILSLMLVSTGSLAAADAAAGKATYTAKCVSCHNAGGEGKDAIAKMMKVELRPLGSKEVQAKTDAELAKIMTDGNGKMKAVAGVDQKTALDVVAFLRTLAKK